MLRAETIEHFPSTFSTDAHLGGDSAVKVEAARAQSSTWVCGDLLMETSFQKAREVWTRERPYRPFERSITGAFVRSIERSRVASGMGR